MSDYPQSPAEHAKVQAGRSEMTDTEVVVHLRWWVVTRQWERRSPFSWPTDACGEQQHLRFARYRNANYERITRENYERFLLNYADALEAGTEPVHLPPLECANAM